MKKLYLLIITTLIFNSILFAQNPKIDHWELLLDVEDTIRYLPGTEAPAANWNELDYSSAAWGTFELNGVGYGGMFDNFNIPIWPYGELATLYTRNEFVISDTADVESMMLEIYYADAFVAYINGTEVARSNMGNSGDTTHFEQRADTIHPNNFDLEWGFFAPGFRIDKELLQTCLKQGNNVLAIELHNDTIMPEAHNYFAWLTVGLKTDEIQYLGEAPWLPNEVDLHKSKLPIIKIDTDLDAPIPDDPKIMAHMQVIWDENSEFNSVSSTTYNYDGYIGIEIRGSSTLTLPKRSYGIETRDSLGENLNVSLLGMPAENDWILYASYMDKTLLRNKLTYNISNEIGLYAPRTRFVELVLNDRLVGTYVLMEKIKRDNNRVDIAGLRPDEIAGDSLTGGYILKIDKTDQPHDGWLSKYGSADKESHKTFFQYVYPKYDDIVFEQMLYIQTFMNDFEESLRMNNFEDPEVGYQKYMDTESFIDYFIMNELTKNLDGYRLSTFMYKDRDDRDGRLHMGPIWDYNLALGNYEAYGGDVTSGWALDFGKDHVWDSYQLPFWWDRLLQDASFVTKLENRWNYLRERTLHVDSIMARIDNEIEFTTDARVRNFEVWPGLFTNQILWVTPLAEDYNGEILFLKNWIRERLTWVDNNIGETREKVNYVSIENESFNEYVGVKAYPNPFTNQVNIGLELEANHHVCIEIYNTLGQKVAQLEDNSLTQGTYEYKWNGNESNGASSNAGIYIYTVNIDGKRTHTGKIIKQ